MDLTEKVIEQKEVFNGDFLRVEKVKVMLPDGNFANRDIVRHPGASALLAFKDAETILLVKQFRMAINKETLEIPAGKLEKGEEPLKAAARELEEETSFKAEEFKNLGTIATGAGFTDEKIRIFKATGLYKGVKGGDDDEFIDVIPMKIEDIKIMIKNGDIIDAKTIAALMYI